MMIKALHHLQSTFTSFHLIFTKQSHRIGKAGITIHIFTDKEVEGYYYYMCTLYIWRWYCWLLNNDCFEFFLVCSPPPPLLITLSYVNRKTDQSQTASVLSKPALRRTFTEPRECEYHRSHFDFINVFTSILANISHCFNGSCSTWHINTRLSLPSYILDLYMHIIAPMCIYNYIRHFYFCFLTDIQKRPFVTEFLVLTCVSYLSNFSKLIRTLFFSFYLLAFWTVHFLKINIEWTQMLLLK